MLKALLSLNLIIYNLNQLPLACWAHVQLSTQSLMTSEHILSIIQTQYVMLFMWITTCPYADIYCSLC